MKVVGVDLAGSSRNETGFCILTVSDNKKSVETRILYSNEELIAAIIGAGPGLVAIDAPLVYDGVRRRCDEMLRQYGALPVTLPGMEVLARRGVIVARELKERSIPCIEVFSTASSKILGVYSRQEFQMQKNMMSLDLDGDPTKRLLIKDELDAISAALTGYLHLIGKTTLVGDESGLIAIPQV